jgi:RNA polymerase sigma-70 factor (ECF subfamily)
MTCDNVPGSTSKVDMREDQLLLERARQGDLDAFESLVDPYTRKLFDCVWRITRNKEDAEDAVQETLLRAFIYFEQFKGTSRFSTWLISIGVNQALMCLRKRRRMVISLDSCKKVDSTEPIFYLAETRPNPEDQYRTKEMAENLNRAIDSLPSGWRTVFELRFVHEFSTKEAAVALDISIAAVKTRAHRARRYVEKQLTGRQDMSHMYI